jgi:tRNA A-37 threonylcarbamoyl transferase component Bud32
MLHAQIPARYRVIKEVGQGGMAVVYKAHDESLKREVAVKLLHAHLFSEPESKSRLQREAQAVAKLHHDNIVQIFDYSGNDADASYIVTEFIDGQTLKQFIANRKPPPPEIAALIAIEICSALAHAHSLGIIHRDVKPENVMVRNDGMLKLMDFGVAQIMDLERMTVTGQLLGSPAYMAPELLEGRPLDVRTDIFSVGILLYQLATGALPFSGRNPHEVLKRIAEGKFADPRTINRLIADRLAKIIARALARRPEDRFPNVNAMIDELTAFVNDAGLTGTRDELNLHFVAPDAYEKEVVPRMIEALVKNGKRLRAEKQTGRALELWNRALAMDPSNREVLAELKRAAQGQHIQRAVVAVVSATLLLGVGYIAMRQSARWSATAASAPEKTPPALTLEPAPAPAGTTATPTSGVPVAPSVVTAAKAATPGSERAGRTEPGARDNDPHPTIAAAPRPRPLARAVAMEKRTFVLAPIPASVHITVDGQPRGHFGPDNPSLELDWSRDHEVEFRNDTCCEPLTIRLGPNHDVPPDGRLPVRLAGRTAFLTVVTDPPTKGSVGVYEIDAEGDRSPPPTIGPISSAISISFRDDSNMSKRLQLTINAEGHAPENKIITLRAGARATEKVKLRN